MKLRRNLIGMLLILVGSSPVYAASEKAATKKSTKAISHKVKPATHSLTKSAIKTDKPKIAALQKLALLQDRLPQVQPVAADATSTQAEIEKAPEIKGNVKVTVTADTPATGVVTHRPGMTKEEQAKPEDRPEQPLRQIITGEDDNELYIFAEDAPIPEKLIANPDAQYAVVGGDEKQIARKVNAYKWASTQVASKVARIKQIAALKAADENKQLEAWRDRNLTIVFDSNDPTNIDVRMLPSGASIRFYLDKLSRQHGTPIPGSHLAVPDVATIPAVEVRKESLDVTMQKSIRKELMADVGHYGYDRAAVSVQMSKLLAANTLTVETPAKVKFATFAAQPQSVMQPKQHVEIRYNKPAKVEVQAAHIAPAVKANVERHQVSVPEHNKPDIRMVVVSAKSADSLVQKLVAAETKPAAIPVETTARSEVKHPTAAELKLQKAQEKIAAYQAKLNAAQEKLEAAEKRLAEKHRLEQEKELAAKRKLQEQEKLEAAKELAQKQKLEEEKREVARQLAAKLKLEEQQKLAAYEAKLKAAKDRLEAAEKRLAEKRRLEREKKLAAQRKIEEQKKLDAERKLAEKRKLEAKKKLEAARQLTAKRKREAELKFEHEMQVAATRKAEAERAAAQRKLQAPVAQKRVAAVNPQALNEIQQQLIQSRQSGAVKQADNSKQYPAPPAYAKDMANLQQAMSERKRQITRKHEVQQKSKQMADKRMQDQLMRELEEFRLEQERKDD